MYWRSRSARKARKTYTIRGLQRAMLRLERLECRSLPSAPLPDPSGFDQWFNGTHRSDEFRAGSGTQLVNAAAGNDHIRSVADGGEPDPAQTGGSGRVNDPVPPGMADDVFFGGAGADTFAFNPLLNARVEVLDQFRSHKSGLVDWERVAGENDNVHDHWVEGFGNDTILDYSKAEYDRIKVTGHTVSLVGIEYGEDEGGKFSLIRIRSDQGAGGGAHNQDLLGTIKVYGDKVNAEDVELDAGVHYGMERLLEANRLAANNGGGGREVISAKNGEAWVGGARVADLIMLGRGSQTFDTGAGNDLIVVLADGGEPDPAQTGGTGRVNDPVDPAQAVDVVRGGLGRDEFVFRLLLNARKEIIAKHTREDGTVNWRGVAGENNAVHDHWVESLGNDVVLDFDKGDGDQLRIEGHTMSIAGITYGKDERGAFSLIRLKSNQGAGGGAHNRDLLGTIKVYGDKVTKSDIKLKAEVHYGIDQLDAATTNDNNAGRAAGMHGSPSKYFKDYVPDYDAEQTFSGSDRGDKFRTGAGRQTVDGGKGGDHFLSFADAGEPDPAQTGGTGRVNDPVPAGKADDIFVGGAGADIFEFLPLLNGRVETLDQYRNHNNGLVNWERVAGENDNVHDHWVDGIGNDTILDYHRKEGDKIKVSGHTVSIAAIEYGADERGTYSLIRLRSNQGAGGGAHNQDLLGTIKVYGDKVRTCDVKLDAGVHYGMEMLREADRLAPHNGGGTRVAALGKDGATYSAGGRVSDLIALGRGSQTVNSQAGHDRIVVLGDGGEPDPDQTGGSGRVNPPVDPALSRDVVRGGLGEDKFVFQLLLNAKQDILDKHRRDDGTIDWHGVAGENGNVHDHWVESLGFDTILDFKKREGDQIRIEGHTIAIAGIEYGRDEGGSYSLIRLKSDQGAGGGAHNGDDLGTIKVYGDQVTECDIALNAGVHYGIDRLDAIDGK